ncbi:MAG: hypothetical protein ACOCQR_00970 [bacterium]
MSEQQLNKFKNGLTKVNVFLKELQEIWDHDKLTDFESNKIDASYPFLENFHNIVGKFYKWEQRLEYNIELKYVCEECYAQFTEKESQENNFFCDSYTHYKPFEYWLIDQFNNGVSYETVEIAENDYIEYKFKKIKNYPLKKV